MVSPLGFGSVNLPPLPLDRTTMDRTPSMKPMEFETQPSLPIVLKGDFYSLVYEPGRMMNRKVAPGTGNLLGVA